jgi:hypothetical protein
MDDQHVVAFVEAIDRTDFHAIHVFALDAIVGDDIGHLAVKPPISGVFAGEVSALKNACKGSVFVPRRAARGPGSDRA